MCGVKPDRTPLVLVTGLHRTPVAQAASDLLVSSPGTVVVHADVTQLGAGVIVRTVREHSPAGVVEHRTAVELAHGCLSCTLRLDLLPLLRTLAGRPDVTRIVLELDPTVEAEHLCWAIEHVVLDEDTTTPETAADLVQVAAVVAVLDRTSWLPDATGDDELGDRGLAALPGDERTVAQVLVGHTSFADALLLAGETPDAWTAAQLTAVLDRLAPSVPRVALSRWDPEKVLGAVHPHSRRGRPTSAHDPLLAGEPPLEEDAGVALVRFVGDRPFHPERLHEAVDVLLDGVVTSRGRVWLASQTDRVLWLESAGGGLRVADAGPWLAALPADGWDDVPVERQAAAALRWDDEHGDRCTELVVLTHRQSPLLLTTALHGALLTDEELSAGPSAWRLLPDPFGEWHTDPCTETDPSDLSTQREERS